MINKTQGHPSQTPLSHSFRISFRNLNKTRKQFGFSLRHSLTHNRLTSCIIQACPQRPARLFTFCPTPCLLPACAVLLARALSLARAPNSNREGDKKGNHRQVIFIFSSMYFNKETTQIHTIYKIIYKQKAGILQLSS